VDTKSFSLFRDHLIFLHFFSKIFCFVGLQRAKRAEAICSLLDTRCRRGQHSQSFKKAAAQDCCCHR
jgi:hypothetical protein